MHKPGDSRNANYWNRIDRANLNSNNSIALNRYENCEKTELLIDKINQKQEAAGYLNIKQDLSIGERTKVSFLDYVSLVWIFNITKIFCSV